MSIGATMLSLAACIITAGSTATAAPMPGAIWTTDASAGPVDKNIYINKEDVYLNGGPRNGSGQGLPDGDYYVQVTEPDGALLGTSVGAAMETPIQVVNGLMVSTYQLSAILITASTQTSGYDNTTNPGGEYKVWLSKNSLFPNSETKTDNFKVKESDNPDDPPIPPQGEISVHKFYDANANATWDPGELEISGWKIAITNTTTGYAPVPQYTVVIVDVEPGNYIVSEFLPVETNWKPTTPASVEFPLADNDVVSVRFGNVCLGTGGGLTLGFWGNKNGQALIDSTKLAMLSALNLKDGAGKDFNPASATALRTWLLNGNAVNMAYMLSVQLTAMELNVASGFVKGSALIYAPGATSANAFGFATVNQIMTEANVSLGAYPNTIAVSPARVMQEALKNALDNANNNKTFVQPTPGPFTF